MLTAGSLILAACLVLSAAHAQLEPEAQEEDILEQAYEIYVPDMMIRGERYQGLIVSSLPADSPEVFRFGAGGDLVLPDSVVLQAGANHVLFDILPVDSTILSGLVSTGITVIPPDGEISEMDLETHPGVGTISRLWIVGPGSGGVVCDGPQEMSVAAIAERAAAGVFDEPDPTKEIRTRLPQTAIHVFLTDRYCTPVTAPAGGVAITLSSDTPAITFGGGSTHVTGTIPEGYNSAVVDVGIGAVGGGGIIYATGTGVSPDAILVENEPVEITVHLGIGPTMAMESSFVTWHVWIERDGRQYIPDGPVPVYLTTDNPVLASFEQTLIDSTGTAFGDIRPHHEFMFKGSASGVLYTGTPAVVGDLRLLAGDRDIQVTAHVPGYGSATASFQVGMPGATGSEFQVNTDQLQECIKEEGALPTGFYSDACNEMWHRLLVASHFFDIEDAGGEPIDTAEETINFLNRLFGGDNTESGQALFELVDRINEYSLSDGATGGLAGDLTTLLGNYLQTTEVTVQPVHELGLTSEMLKRIPADPPPNGLILESFPGMPGTANVVISTLFKDESFTFPVYIPDGTITLSSDSGLVHPPQIHTYGSAPRHDTPGTRPSAVVVPVKVQGGGTLTASLGGVGSYSVAIDDIAPSEGKRLHVATLPGSGERDMIALLSVVDADGLLTNHHGEIYVEAGQGAFDVELVGWRGGGGMIRGSVDGVGEIIVHAPGLGGGTALTTPVRHEVDMDVWYPGVVHVAEEFPLVVHTLDSEGLPIRRVQAEISGDVQAAGGGLALMVGGETPVIVEHEGMFHSGIIHGFLNRADVNVNTLTGSLVELNDTVVVNIDTGAMYDPEVMVSGGGLLFSGERERWEALADTTGEYTVEVNVFQPGWESYSETLSLKVSNLAELDYDATTIDGTRVDVNLTTCGQTVLPGGFFRMEPGLCEVFVPEETTIGGITHHLDSLVVNGQGVRPGATFDFDGDSEVRAIYRGVITVEMHAIFPDGTSAELMWNRYTPGDRVTIMAEPQYEFWGLVWDRPDRWVGLPAGAFQVGDVAEWTAAEDVTVTVEYVRDLKFVLVALAAGLGIPIVVFMRHRIPGLRFK